MLRYSYLLTCCIFFVLSACSTDQDAANREFIDLPAEGRTLVIGSATPPSLTDLAAQVTGLGDREVSYALLNEDSLFTYRNLALLQPNFDSLTVHQRRAVERFVLAGGRLYIQDDRPAIPFEWAWYDDVRTQSAGQVVSVGTGQVYANEVAAEQQALLAYFSEPITPATAPVTVPPAAPRDDRFRIEVLDDNIYEPMEMEVLPGGEVLFLERRGKMKRYNPRTGATELIRDFPVCIEGNYEDGLHGIALDPGYGKTNHHIFVYYSPLPCDSTDQYLSRFEYRDGKLNVESEVIVLRVPVQRKSCCHSGGSVEFGPDGLLYLSTGDNTSSKESNGYSPLDERPGRGPYDSQKGSSNTNDLRGKIIRIRPTADGGYEIPEGNLFAPGTELTKPEIFVMGARNPFRIAIDPWSNYLYWGDVGPDVGEAGRYGPQSYDEWNQAQTAGNYGWPYFVGDNFAYPRRDFATDEVGELFDPAAPVNESPNNTGLRELPEARPAMIWYPYGPSEEFPQLGNGSRSAMAGPFYNPDTLLPITTSALPDYYAGKWFIYEWARSWIKVVTFDEKRQNIVQIEDFLPDFPISKPIDMKIGRDGAIYLLEYGNDYFLNNPDARLVRISYSARNRPPVAQLQTDETAGGLPFQPTLTANGSYDPDPDDSLSYRWYLDGTLSGEETTFQPIIAEAGPHKVELEVIDAYGTSATTQTVLTAGNARPRVELALNGNRSFLFDGGRNALSYTTTIEDPEDAKLGGLDMNRAVVNAAWLDDPTLLEGLRRGTAQLPGGNLEYASGAALIAESDCYTCHKERSENVGPAYLAVADRYPDTEANISMLATKVIKGGNGNWGDRLMSGHPTLSPADARTMVGYILSLNDGSKLPLRGTVRAGEGRGTYVIAARYRDDGGMAGTAPLVGQGLLMLRSPRIQLGSENEGTYRGYIRAVGEEGSEQNVVELRPGGYVRLANIDLTGVSRVDVEVMAASAGLLELRHGSTEGTLVAQVEHGPSPDGRASQVVRLPLVGEALGLPQDDLYFVWKGPDGKVADDMGHHRPAALGWLGAAEFVSGATVSKK